MRLQHFLALWASLSYADARCGSSKNTTSVHSTIGQYNTASSVSTSSLVSIISSIGTRTLASTTNLDSATSSETTSSSVGTTIPASTTISAGTTDSASTTGSESTTTSTTSSVSTTSTSSLETTSSSVGTTTQASTTISASTTSSESTTTSSVSTTSTSSSVSSTIPEPTQICQAHGTRPLSVPLVSSTTISDNTFNGCLALCMSTTNCESFSIQIQTGGACSLYATRVYLDFSVGTSGPTVYFDVTCPKPVVSGPAVSAYTATGSPASVPTAPGAAVTFSEYVAPAITSSDSPDFSAEPTATPTDDNEFIKTYTYTEFEKTLAAMGSPPVTTGIPQPSGTDLPDLPCMVTAGPAHPFTVLNENFVPMVSRTGSVGPMLQPTEAPVAGDPILDPSTYTVPSFYLQAVQGADDVYDMVYGDTNQFVAMAADGQIVLVDASTGPAFIGGHVTSIFSSDCYGRITISLGGAKYQWSTSGQSSTMTLSTSARSNIVVLPVSLPQVSELLKDRKRTEELTDKLLARSALRERLTNADTHAPQCPSTPPGLVSHTKSDYEMGEGNLCDGMSDWWELSPFDFGDACDIQALCYDMCEDFSWVGCNAIFYAAALVVCSDEIGDSWWDVVALIACGVQSVYFTAVAATDTGRDLYFKAQKSMCRCFCSSPPDTCLYVDSGAFYCADLHGTDGDNCGGCGTQCGAKLNCKAGGCSCPAQTCGTTCVDFRNNPNHCGGCDNVCASKYCVNSKCYTPSPDECAPDQSVTNHMFEDWKYGFTNWTMAAYGDAALKTDVVFGASSYTPQTGDAVTALSVTMNNVRAGGFHAALTQKKVKVCPNYIYDLTFSMGYVNQVNGVTVVSSADCYVRWLTGPPTVWSANEGYQSSPNYLIGASNPTYKTFGNWDFSVKEGDLGVTKVKANLYVDLTAVISCDTPVGGTGHFIITDIEINQQGTTSKRAPVSEFEAAQALRQRDSSEAINITEALQPYIPVQAADGEPVTVSYKSINVKSRNNLDGWA